MTKLFHIKADFIFYANSKDDAYDELARYFGTLADSDFIEYDIVISGECEVKPVKEKN